MNVRTVVIDLGGLWTSTSEQDDLRYVSFEVGVVKYQIGLLFTLETLVWNYFLLRSRTALLKVERAVSDRFWKRSGPSLNTFVGAEISAFAVKAAILKQGKKKRNDRMEYVQFTDQQL